jgi:hypothetical protein
MAPKRKWDPMAEAAKLQQRATALQNKGYYTQIIAWLKDNPQLVPNIYHTMAAQVNDVGRAPELPLSQSASPSPIMAADVPGTPISSSLAPCSSATSSCSSAADSSQSDTLAVGAYNFMTLGVTKLMQILSNLEPSTLNSFNLKGLLPRGQRANNKQVLLEILCMACGVSAQDTLTPHKTYSAVEKSLAALYEKLGRRCRGLVLPLDWQVSGVYSFRWHGGQLLLKHKFLPGAPEVAAPQAFVDSVVDKSCLTLLNNYSETQATLVEENTVKSIVLKSIFNQVDTPPLARCRPIEASPAEGPGASSQKQKKRKNLGKAAASIMKKWKQAGPAGDAKPARPEAGPAALADEASQGKDDVEFIGDDEVAAGSAASSSGQVADELSLEPPGPDADEA